MSEPLPSNPEEQPPKPPIPLDYSSLPEPSALPPFIVGFILTFIGLGFFTGVIFIANNLPYFPAGATQPVRPPRGPQIQMMVIEFAAAAALSALLYFLLGRDWRRRRPFLLGLLAGLCAACLVSGICWAAGR